MEALTLTRKDYEEALNRVDEACADGAYLSRFKVVFPDGMNTASVLEICRVIQSPTMEQKIRLMRLCVSGKNVEVECPNGDKESFCMTGTDDNFEAFSLFQREPLALIAIADAIYGYVLKKYVRLSKPGATTAKQA